ncbi:MAG: hypothetical protein QOG99_340 [Frankiales bacterium]|jgi:hypothetical protein|nr:hypothetical protein [Frankiales bacterium]
MPASAPPMTRPRIARSRKTCRPDTGEARRPVDRTRDAGGGVVVGMSVETVPFGPAAHPSPLTEDTRHYQRRATARSTQRIASVTTRTTRRPRAVVRGWSRSGKSSWRPSV